MPNDFDRVDIDIDPAVAAELSQWDRVASDLHAMWKEKIAKIQQLNNPSTWGADTPGLAFQASYYQGGSLFQMIINGGQIIADVVAEPARIRKAVANSLTTDHDQGLMMNNLQA
ncbi:hypothetical protein [Streptosporangium roseum]|uniref:Uncharacterized protein n=1 Tax=Streptosporangium roseum (strain ATCC 12428 / DSM 43021 / JCM 3005 / KCTC 9067 / NCIMB 10171 / NRRL 2505 / NI 9100) TaxID=479432 RepID=D2BAV7_STRRD|nr:hypothetical protein [Streptosporangium roseum]ACZ91721.1 hypothetical protein Sros_9098 [Streptosporangium roseum DSM 43021]